MEGDVFKHGLVFHQLFQIALDDHKVQQLGSVVFLGVLIFLLHLADLALELDDLLQVVAFGLFGLRRFVVGALFRRRGF